MNEVLRNSDDPGAPPHGSVINLPANSTEVARLSLTNNGSPEVFRHMDHTKLEIGFEKVPAEDTTRYDPYSIKASAKIVGDGPLDYPQLLQYCRVHFQLWLSTNWQHINYYTAACPTVPGGG